MKNKLIISIIYLACILCSCSNTDVIGIAETSIIIQEGEQKIITIDGDSLSVTLISVKPVFSEGEYSDQGGRFITVYDASVKFDDKTIDFRTTSEINDKQNNIVKDWNRLEKTVDGIKTYKSHRIGVADLYPENGRGSLNPGKHIMKLLIR
ncbi:hypothetical protein [Arcicella rosea]|uniref:Lipoprotein n=1 Tax=Arcicella rosea TaxID=502909 RepID=A0A841ENF8_9BACT|nr:hypothetical protein [Arcicella rosea]MBB6002268.1 hypothetical protein [Arcicella rosea]